ncbi:MAG: hypothetical protein WDN45_06285 [Caulobacteraceae bacterium]
MWGRIARGGGLGRVAVLAGRRAGDLGALRGAGRRGLGGLGLRLQHRGRHHGDGGPDPLHPARHRPAGRAPGLRRRALQAAHAHRRQCRRRP